MLIGMMPKTCRYNVYNIYIINLKYLYTVPSHCLFYHFSNIYACAISEGKTDSCLSGEDLYFAENCSSTLCFLLLVSINLFWKAFRFNFGREMLITRYVLEIFIKKMKYCLAPDSALHSAPYSAPYPKI